MSVTFLGWIIIPIAVVTSLISPNRLYLMMIFFAAFSASAVLNFSGFGLQVIYFMAILLFVRLLIETLYKGKLLIPTRIGISFILLSLFVIVTLVSLIMPLLIDGDLLVFSYSLKGYVPHVLSLHNISQACYVLFGSLIAVMVAYYNSNFQRMAQTLKVMVWSVMFVSLWGLFQLVCFLLGLQYPDFLFNNSASEAARNFGGILNAAGINFKRISSVTTEPSFLAQFLLVIAPIPLCAIMARKPIISKRMDFFALFILLTTALLSTSATALIGLIFLFLLFMLNVVSFRELRTINSLFIFLLAILLCISILPVLGPFLNKFLIHKVDTGSAMERMFLLRHAWTYFCEYPILGIGWGSAGSSDLFVFLLANAGLFGLFSFFIFTIYLISQQRLPSQMLNSITESLELRVRLIAIRESLLMLLFINSFTGMAYVHGHFWIILGISMAIPCFHRQVD